MAKRESASAAHALTLSFPQLDREIAGHKGETIYQSARRSGVRIIGACGGRGTCGTCRVLLVEGEIEPGNEEAMPRTASSGKRPRWLRACQVTPKSDCVLEVAARSLAPVVRAEIDAGESVEILALDPAVVSRDINVPKATLADNLSDLDRVVRALANPLPAVDLTAARQLPAALRDGDWSLRAHIRGPELIGFAQAGRRTFGLAVDLGTTNVAGFLVDLQTGVRVASLGIENPQVTWGADVISRMNHAIQGPANATELRQAASTAINALAHDLCFSFGAATTDIVDVAICGNTAMHHLLLGLPVRQLGRAPFVAAVRDAMDIKARELDLSICPGAYVHLAPNIGGFVGSDHVTALLATEDQWLEGAATLVMDIGTNTEISLIHRGGIVSASSEGEGKGATFVVKLPVSAVRSEERHPAPTRKPVLADRVKERRELAGIKILVVDDEPDTSELLRFVFNETGAIVQTAGSAAEALQVFDTWKPDILVSDIGMPDVDGYEHIRIIREERKSHIPAVALTAMARVDDRVKALTAGYQMHVAKPVEPVELITIAVALTGFVNRLSAEKAE